MSNSHNGERSHSDDYAKYTDQRIQDVQLRSAEIGKGTIIKRALPSRQKRLVGAWCFFGLSVVMFVLCLFFFFF